MTTERRAWRRYIPLTGAILAGWFGIVATLTVVIEPTTSVVVVGPLSSTLRAAGASGMSIVEVHAAFSRLHSDRKGFVRDLYRNGAWMVWPSIEGGCLFSFPKRRA